MPQGQKNGRVMGFQTNDVVWHSAREVNNGKVQKNRQRRIYEVVVVGIERRAVGMTYCLRRLAEK